jgi:uncharacterized membrane protein
MMSLNQSIGRFERGLFLFLLVYLIGLCVLTPPFQVPDENAHFYRAIQISQFEIIPSRNENSVGGNIPTSLVESANRLQSGIPFNPQNKFSLNTLQSEISRKLNEADTKFVGFPNTALYSPVPYIVAGSALWVLKKLSLPPPFHLYISRISNVLCAGILIFFSVSIFPILSIPMLLLAFMPMFAFQLASTSADSIMFALSVFYACSLTRSFFELKGDTDQQLRYFCASTFSFALLISCKQAYLPTGLPLLALLFFGYEKKQLFVTKLFFAAFVSLPFLYWNYRIQSYFVPTRLDVLIDPGQQLKFILTSPNLFFNLLVQSLWSNRGVLWQEMIGVLGWLDTWLNPKINDFLGLSLFLSIFMIPKQKLQLSNIANLLLLASVILSALLIVVLIYMSWNPPGYLQTIEGLQGRYFLPLLPLVFVLVASLSRITIPTFLLDGSLFSKLFVSCFVGLSVWTTINGIITRYYIVAR